MSTFFFVSLEEGMDFELRLSFFIVALSGSLTATYGLLCAVLDGVLWGLVMFVVGFAVQTFAFKSYIDEVTK
jgi:hypothetical protein